MTFSLSHPDNVRKFLTGEEADAALPSDIDFEYKVLYSRKSGVYLIAAHRDGILQGYMDA